MELALGPRDPSFGIDVAEGFQSLFLWNLPSDKALLVGLGHAFYVSILVFVELALGQRLFFVLFLISQRQTGLFSPSLKHEWNLLEGL